VNILLSLLCDEAKIAQKKRVKAGGLTSAFVNQGFAIQAKQMKLRKWFSSL